MDGAVHTALHAVLFFAQQPVHGNLQNVRDHHHLKVSHKPAAVFDPAYHVYNIQIVKDCIYESHGRRYYVTHGDIFDTVTTQMKWLAKLGDTGYTFLLWLNKVYNLRRMKQGKPYYSLSQSIKNRVKTAVSYISDFEKELVDLARAKKCDGVICGHIHHPANTFYEDIHYLNSGDWVETLSALTEDEDGNWTIRYFDSGLLKEDNHKEKQTISITIAS